MGQGHGRPGPSGSRGSDGQTPEPPGHVEQCLAWWDKQFKYPKGFKYERPKAATSLPNRNRSWRNPAQELANRATDQTASRAQADRDRPGERPAQGGYGTRDSPDHDGTQAADAGFRICWPYRRDSARDRSLNEALIVDLDRGHGTRSEAGPPTDGDRRRRATPGDAESETLGVRSRDKKTPGLPRTSCATPPVSILFPTAPGRCGGHAGHGGNATGCTTSPSRSCWISWLRSFPRATRGRCSKRSLMASPSCRGVATRASPTAWSKTIAWPPCGPPRPTRCLLSTSGNAMPTPVGRLSTWTADLLQAAGKGALAVRVLSNLAEPDPENPAMLRVVGYRLLDWGRLDAAVLTFEEVLRLRPEEPQTTATWPWPSPWCRGRAERLD